jgi:hypothetical protein
MYEYDPFPTKTIVLYYDVCFLSYIQPVEGCQALERRREFARVPSSPREYYFVFLRDFGE